MGDPGSTSWPPVFSRTSSAACSSSGSRGRGARRRATRQVLELERQITTTNERAFADQLGRGVQPLLATMTRLDTAIALDDRIVALRAEIERETAAKLREGVVTASEYVDRNTDLLSARLASAQHRVELAQARAGYLTTLGLEIPQ